jgi:ribosomal protein S25
MDSLGETRRRSAALFGNEKAVEVLLSLDEEGTATAQMVAAKTGISYSLVRDAMIRLSLGGAIRQLPRVGGSRSPLYYQPVKGDLWDALIIAVRAVIAISQETADQGTARGTLPRQ